MNTFQNSDALQRLLRFGFNATGYIVTAGLVLFLILAWILTAPLFRRGVYLGDLYRIRFDPKMKGRL